MKTVFYYLCAAAAILVSCTDLESYISAEKHSQACRLNLKFVDGGPFTKGEVPIDESAIEDINLFIFNPDKSLFCSSFARNGNILFEDIMLFTNTGYTIYAVANWGMELGCRTVEELENLVYKGEDLKSLHKSRAVNIMGGKLENAKLSVHKPLVMELCRLLGRVHIKCNFSNVAGGVELTIKKVALKNVPAECLVFNDNVAVEVGDGSVLQGEGVNGITRDGVDFYMFENLQGEIERSVGYKNKAELLGEKARNLASYVEFECDLVSARKRGEIIYRFYLGGIADCNVKRNVSQNITVNFAGNVSQDENSISVDNSALVNRVTNLMVYPALISFAPGKLGRTYQCWVDLYPATAYNKEVKWYSSDNSVAVVDETGLITTIGLGECDIWAYSCDNPQLKEKCVVYVR